MNVRGREVEKERRFLLGSIANPVRRFFGQSGSDFFVVIAGVRGFGSADLIDTEFLIEDSGLRRFVVNERIVLLQADDVMILDKDERGMAVDHRNSEVVVETEFQRSRVER